MVYITLITLFMFYCGTHTQTTGKSRWYYFFIEHNTLVSSYYRNVNLMTFLKVYILDKIDTHFHTLGYIVELGKCAHTIHVGIK